MIGPLAVLLREALWPRLLHLVVVDATWILLVLLGSTLMAAASAREPAGPRPTSRSAIQQRSRST